MRVDSAAVRRGFVLAVGVVCITAACGGRHTATRATPATVQVPATKRQLKRGRALFQGIASGQFGCGFCHTLRSAASSSIVAEDLDAEFASDRASGWTDQRVARDVLTYIKYGVCRDPHDATRCMPKGLYRDASAVAVAAFVATCAARSHRPRCEPAGGLRGEALQGERDYTMLGCIGCHWTNPGTKPIAPTLVGVYGSEAPLANGTSVRADTRYLLRSILDPNADTVRGFPYGFMGARIKPGEISRIQARALVAYIKTQKRLPFVTHTR